MTDTCGEQLAPATRYEPAEHCGNDTAPGEDRCPDHGGAFEADTIQEKRYEA